MTVSTGSSSRGGSGGSLRFQDFNNARSDQPFFMGDNWLQCGLAGNPSPGSGISIAAAWNVAGGILSMGVSGGNGQSIAMSIAWNMDLATLSTRRQYAEYKLTANNSIPGSWDRRGPMVYARPNAGRCYVAQISIDTTNCQLVRVDNANVTTANLGAAFTVAVGDTIRIEADNSDPAQTIVKGYRNGILQVTVNDSNASRLTSGLVGIYDAFCSTGIVSSITNFDGGAL